MSLRKSYPNSDNGRSTVLTAAKTKKDASLPGDNVISAENSAARAMQVDIAVPRLTQDCGSI